MKRTCLNTVNFKSQINSCEFHSYQKKTNKLPMQLRIVFTLIFTLLILLTGPLANAQEPEAKFGTDSIECLKNSSLYREFVKQNNIKDALPYWRWVYKNCPASSKNIYIDGVKIYTHQIANAKDDASKEAFIDSLVFVYSKRIEFFGQAGFVNGRLGVDLLRFRPNELSKAYDVLTLSVDEMGKSIEDAVAITFMQASAYLYKNAEIEKEQTLNDFTNVLGNMEARLSQFVKAGDQAKADRTKTAIESIENAFMESGAADCDVLEPYFAPKFNESPGDIELLTKITKLMEKAYCTDSDLYYDAAKQLHKIEPSAGSSASMARAALKRDLFKESSEFYLQAIELNTDDSEKSRLYYELGLITFSQLNNNQLARTYAYKSIESDKTNGKPYILIGNLYAASAKSCGDDDFKQRTVYWAAVDKFEQAKKIDASLVIEANKLIEAYSPYFPDSEVLFFNGLQEGDSFTVGCWINEKTTIRKN